jgi:hypothetical protein
MSVSGVSFWQQDQSFWGQAASNSASAAQSNATIDRMFGASTTLSAGLASIANESALNRVNNQLSAAVQSALASIEGNSSGTTGSSSTASTSSSGSSSASSSSPSSSSNSSGTSSSTSTPGAPAIGTGTVPLTAGTSLFTLGIVATDTFTVSDGTNTTIYKSNGHDTVGDLINALNKNVYGNAQVTAYLNSSGQLTISGQNDTAMITIGGTNASSLGFSVGNTFFKPTAPTSSSSTASGSSTTSGSSGTSSSSGTGGSSGSANSSSASSTTNSSTSAASFLLNSALALQTGSTAETLLSANGLSGSLINLLA